MAILISGEVNWGTTAVAYSMQALPVLIRAEIPLCSQHRNLKEGDGHQVVFS